MHISAVVLCAGRGTRMLPLTEHKPKPLQEVLGKSLLAWKLDALPAVVTDIVLVVGYMGELIRETIGDSWKGKRVRYVVQEELNGTMGALALAKDLLPERFIVMMGDDLYDATDLQKLSLLSLGVVAKRVRGVDAKGQLMLTPEGNFKNVSEQFEHIEDGLLNTGLYVLSRAIFDVPPVPSGGTGGELGLPQTLALLAKHTPIPVIETARWLQITTPDDLLRAEREFFM